MILDRPRSSPRRAAAAKAQSGGRVAPAAPAAPSSTGRRRRRISREAWPSRGRRRRSAPPRPSDAANASKRAATRTGHVYAGASASRRGGRHLLATADRLHALSLAATPSRRRLARDRRRGAEAAIARAARACGRGPTTPPGSRILSRGVVRAFADVGAMAKQVEAQSRSPAGSRPLASPRVAFTEGPKPKAAWSRRNSSATSATARDGGPPLLQGG